MLKTFVNSICKQTFAFLSCYQVFLRLGITIVVNKLLNPYKYEHATSNLPFKIYGNISYLASEIFPGHF